MASAIAETDPPNATLAWLLEPSNPSARYLALTRVLGLGEETPEVRASRLAIPETPPARDILAAQYPQGYWMHPGIGCSPRYRATIWQILLLAQLGMPRCDRLDRAVVHLLKANQRQDGAFRASEEPDDTPLGLNGSLLWALETLGYGERREVGEAWSWLLSVVKADWLCRPASRGGSPLWGAVKVLWAANAVPPQRRTEAVEGVSRAAADILLDAPPHPGQEDPRWFRLTFPLTEAADLLQWMAVLTASGYGHDPRLATARSWLMHKRDSRGWWPLERMPGKLWADFGNLNEANKWTTIRALALAC